LSLCASQSSVVATPEITIGAERGKLLLAFEGRCNLGATNKSIASLPVIETHHSNEQIFVRGARKVLCDEVPATCDLSEGLAKIRIVVSAIRGRFAPYYPDTKRSPFVTSDR
jgi:hypothetical protein